MRHESDETLDLITNFSAVVNSSKLFIDNASPYEHIVGDILTDVKQTTINGNGVEISNIEITDIYISDIELRSSWDIDDIDTYLIDSELILRYFNGGGYSEYKLAKFRDVITGDKEITYTLDQNELSAFMHERPDEMFFTFQFNGRQKDALKVTYEIYFSYNYSYEEREVK